MLDAHHTGEPALPRDPIHDLAQSPHAGTLRAQSLVSRVGPSEPICVLEGPTGAATLPVTPTLSSGAPPREPAAGPMGTRSTSGVEPGTERPGEEGLAGSGTCLGEDRLQVVLDGVLRDVEPPCEVACGGALHEGSEDLALARGQPVAPAEEIHPVQGRRFLECHDDPRLARNVEPGGAQREPVPPPPDRCTRADGG